MELYEARLRSRERFQELVRRWEAKQLQAAAAKEPSPEINNGDLARALSGIRERGEPSDTHPEKRFQELRQHWEAKKDEDGKVKGEAVATAEAAGV